MRFANEQLKHENVPLLERFGAEAQQNKRLAREIHDTVATHVVSASLLLEQMRGRTEDEDVQRSLDELCDELSHALRDLRSFCFLLDEPKLTEREWHITLDRFVRGFARRAGLELVFDFDVKNAHIGTLLQSVTLRILQEALVNVARHAQARHVVVRVFADGEAMRLEISDDGIGLPPDTMPGVGFGSMAERSREVDGECRIASSPSGTTVTARLPLTH